MKLEIKFDAFEDKEMAELKEISKFNIYPM